MNVRIHRTLPALLAGMMMLGGVAHAQDDASIMDQLNLSGAQREQIRTLQQQFRSETEPLRTEIRQLQKQVRQLKSASPVNESQLEARLREQAALEIKLSLAITRYQEKIEAVLTPQQRALLKKLQEARR